MSNPAEICDEVSALLDRMDKFPGEFLDDELYSGRWGWVQSQIRGDNPTSGFTEAESTAITNKLTELTRIKLKDRILKTILHAQEEMSQMDLLDSWELSRGMRQRRGLAPSPYVYTTDHTASVQALENNMRIQAIQAMQKDIKK